MARVVVSNAIGERRDVEKRMRESLVQCCGSDQGTDVQTPAVE